MRYLPNPEQWIGVGWLMIPTFTNWTVQGTYGSVVLLFVTLAFSIGKFSFSNWVNE